MAASSSEPVSIGDWMLTYFLLFIPLVGLIMLFVWAFGSHTPPSKANWAKALLLWGLIGILFYVGFLMAFGGSVWLFSRG